jgi:hypothetical protein
VEGWLTTLQLGIVRLKAQITSKRTSLCESALWWPTVGTFTSEKLSSKRCLCKVGGSFLYSPEAISSSAGAAARLDAGAGEDDSARAEDGAVGWGADDPGAIVRLLRQVVQVSVETVKEVEGLPELGVG